MSNKLLSALQPILNRLEKLAAQDDAVRDELRSLGEALIELSVPLSAVNLTLPGRPVEASIDNDKNKDSDDTKTGSVLRTELASTEPTSVAAKQDKPPEVSAKPDVRQLLSSGTPSPAIARLSASGSIRRENLSAEQDAVSGDGPYTPPAWVRHRLLQPNWRTIQVNDADLPLIAERCRLKAEAARWAAARRRKLTEGADLAYDIDPIDRDLIARAKMLPECFLWMIYRDAAASVQDETFENLAGCFDAAGASAAMLHQLMQEPGYEQSDFFEKALELAAEAQSALRIAASETGYYNDGDQVKIFSWLRAIGADRQILIQRFMRKDDPADPTIWRDIQVRITRTDELLQHAQNRDKRQHNLLNKARYHLKLIQNDPQGAAEYSAATLPGTTNDQDRRNDQHWRKIFSTVDEIVEQGMAPSAVELRDLLLPVLEQIPEEIELSQTLRAVLIEIDRYLASRPNEQVILDSNGPTPEVSKVAELLRSQAIVLIGGERRLAAAEAIKSAFGIKELIWLEGRDQAYTFFEPEIARPDVVVVLLAIRWSRHGFGEIREFCEHYGKPLVRLPGGYNPNQIAHHILNQVGERLQRTSYPAQ
jgi:hypothetical protein